MKEFIVEALWFLGCYVFALILNGSYQVEKLLNTNDIFWEADIVFWLEMSLALAVAFYAGKLNLDME
jgi:hypothetical protein